LVKERKYAKGREKIKRRIPLTPPPFLRLLDVQNSNVQADRPTGSRSCNRPRLHARDTKEKQRLLNGLWVAAMMIESQAVHDK
jgi:hypothetical protein